MLGEGPEIGVAGEKGDAVVDADLGDQGVGQFGLQPALQQTSAGSARALPEPRSRIHDGDCQQVTPVLGREKWIAEQFYEHHGAMINK